jgi:hypothetical protein
MTTLSQLSGSNQVLTLEHLNSLTSTALKLTILTFNLAKYVQLNEIKGSESIMVEKCQLAYPRNNGLSEDGQLSQCTLNASKLIGFLRCDLMGFQECVEPSFSRMLQRIKQESGRNYTSIGTAGKARKPGSISSDHPGCDSVQIIYDQDKLGNGIMLSKPGLHILEPTRLMMVVWFPHTKILAINLHAPHDFDSEKEITNTFNSVDIPSSIMPRRIIMTGDFNDSYRSPLEEITFLGMKLKQHNTPNNKPPNTCCTDSNYQWAGDYIFDSDYHKNGYYGIPRRSKNDTSSSLKSIFQYPEILMSDHHPVIYAEYTI